MNHHLHKKVAKFVEGFGVEALAQRLDVNPSAIYHWCGARVQLRQEHARTLQTVAKESGFRLSLDEIYFFDDEGLAKLRSARERRKLGRLALSEESGSERFDSLEAGLDFARGSTGRLV